MPYGVSYKEITEIVGKDGISYDELIDIIINIKKRFRSHVILAIGHAEDKGYIRINMGDIVHLTNKKL